MKFFIKKVKPLLCIALSAGFFGHEVNAATSLRECVVVRGTLSPKIVLAARSRKNGKLVEMLPKTNPKAATYIGKDQETYTQVGYLKFKTPKSTCSNKDITNTLIKEFVDKNKLDTASVSRMSSSIANLSVLPTKSTPSAQPTSTGKKPTKKPQPKKKPKLSKTQVDKLKNSPEAIKKRAERAAKKAAAKKPKLTQAQINALKNSPEAKKKRAERAAKKAQAEKQAQADLARLQQQQQEHANNQALAATLKDYEQQLHEQFVEDEADYLEDEGIEADEADYEYEAGEGDYEDDGEYTEEYE